MAEGPCDERMRQGEISKGEPEGDRNERSEYSTPSKGEAGAVTKYSDIIEARLNGKTPHTPKGILGRTHRGAGNGASPWKQVRFPEVLPGERDRYSCSAGSVYA